MIKAEAVENQESDSCQSSEVTTCQSDEPTTSEKKSPYLPPCRICLSPASGFHYGVNTCEACKGFFRRSLARKTPFPGCQHNNDCKILYEQRNACAACRHKKCLQLGMSRDAIKTGRYTHDKRTKDTNEIKAVCLPSVQDLTQVPTPPTDEHSIQIQKLREALTRDFQDIVHMSTCLNEVRETINRFHNPAKPEVLKICDGELVQSLEMDILNEYISSIDLSKEIHGFDITKCRILFEFVTRTFEKSSASFVSYCKSLTTFRQLPLDDQITLIRNNYFYSLNLLAAVKFIVLPDYYVHYDAGDKTYWIIPQSIMSYIMQGPGGTTSTLNHLFILMMKKFKLIHNNIDVLSVLVPIGVYSDEDLQLSVEGREQINKFQAQLMELLNKVLNMNGFDSKVFRILIELLTNLRDIKTHSESVIKETRQILSPSIPPLLKEIWPQPNK